MAGRAASMNTGAVRLAVRADGIVQGVGFRPMIYTLAHAYGLSGFVRNDSTGLSIEVQGPPEEVQLFVREVKNNPPPRAQMSTLQISELPPREDLGFEILVSDVGPDTTTSVPLESATCPQCLAEMRDRSDRRHGHAFINCTDCGPRFTLIRSLPYDRHSTTMSVFAMCDECLAEYEDASSRRFHAQPTSCPRCGPTLQLIDSRAGPVEEDDLPGRVATSLMSGGIVAIKGLGGFHLACDAMDEAAVAELRRRKHRAHKPLAVMVASEKQARRTVRIGSMAIQLMADPTAPIVLADKLVPDPLAAGVAPGTSLHGVMLPYTPVHHLVFASMDTQIPLVMTSANVEGEPMITDGADEALRDMADLVLDHDRVILHRLDDTVVRATAAGPVTMRRARGFAPASHPLPLAAPPVLAVGADLKNTVTLAQEWKAIMGPHVGDLESPASLGSFRSSIEHLRTLTSIIPVHVACDLHPDMHSTRWAIEESGLDPVHVQHHVAHSAACLADANQWAHCIGVVMDGMGRGSDGTIWGGEFFTGDPASPTRAGHIEPLPQPGGDLAARHPWRMAISMLDHALGPDALDLARRFTSTLPEEQIEVVLSQIRAGVASPLTSSAGRLFDAVAALVCGCRENSYESQSAAVLEAAVDPSETGHYPVLLAGGETARLDPAPMIEQLVQDIESGVSPGVTAARFHSWLVEGIVQVCDRLRDATGLRIVTLSGGCFANAVLLSQTTEALSSLGFSVLGPRSIPPGDGGISLGQAAVAAARLQEIGS